MLQEQLVEPGITRSAGAGFRSILFPDAGEFFTDLNLDQFVAETISGRREYRLAGLFHTPLRTVEAIGYRQDAVRDLHRPDVRGCVDEFADRMRDMRRASDYAGRLRHRYQVRWWFLRAVRIYCGAVRRLAGDLGEVRPESTTVTVYLDTPLLADGVQPPHPNRNRTYGLR
jgi:hypothetical protein